MDEDYGKRAEVEDALDTTDQLHMDVSRLKRLGILTPEEDQVAKQRIEEINETLAKKLPEE